MRNQQIDRTIHELSRCLFLGTYEDDREILNTIKLLEQIKDG